MANHRRWEWSDVGASFAEMGPADGIAVHHGASRPLMTSFDPALLRNMEHYEMNVGYNAMAYHTMFSDDGDSAEARPYGAMGAATGGHNEHTIAFCHPGYFHPPYFDQVSDAALLAMAREIRSLVDLGFLVPDYIVRPHTWWTAGTQWATACCGSEFIPKVALIEQWSHDLPGPAPEPEPDLILEGEMHLFRTEGTEGPSAVWTLWDGFNWTENVDHSLVWALAVAGVRTGVLSEGALYRLKVIVGVHVESLVDRIAVAVAAKS